MIRSDTDVRSDTADSPNKSVGGGPERGGASPTIFMVEHARRLYIRIDESRGQELDYEAAGECWSRVPQRDLHSIVAIERIQPDDVPHGVEPVGVDIPTRYLWQALEHVSMAIQRLTSARHREGHCPEIDALSRDLRRIDVQLWSAAVEVDEERRLGRSGVIHDRPQESP